jgi:hypothetical protein
VYDKSLNGKLGCAPGAFWFAQTAERLPDGWSGNPLQHIDTVWSLSAAVGRKALLNQYEADAS